MKLWKGMAQHSHKKNTEIQKHTMSLWIRRCSAAAEDYCQCLLLKVLISRNTLLRYLCRHDKWPRRRTKHKLPCNTKPSRNSVPWYNEWLYRGGGHPTMQSYNPFRGLHLICADIKDSSFATVATKITRKIRKALLYKPELLNECRGGGNFFAQSGIVGRGKL